MSGNKLHQAHGLEGQQQLGKPQQQRQGVIWHEKMSSAAQAPISCRLNRQHTWYHLWYKAIPVCLHSTIYWKVFINELWFGCCHGRSANIHLASCKCYLKTALVSLNRINQILDLNYHWRFQTLKFSARQADVSPSLKLSYPMSPWRRTGRLPAMSAVLCCCGCRCRLSFSARAISKYEPKTTP